MTNYQKHAKRQKEIDQQIRKQTISRKKRIKKYLRISAIAVVLSLVGGCNSAIQLANGIGKDMQVGGAGIQSMTDKQKDIGSFSFKRDSIALDGEGW